MDDSVSAVYLYWCLWVRLYQQYIYIDVCGWNCISCLFILISLGALCKIDVCGWDCISSLFILMFVSEIVSAVYLHWCLWVKLYQQSIYIDVYDMHLWNWTSFWREKVDEQERSHFGKKVWQFLSLIFGKHFPK
jgi:hypothetical protein